MYVGVTTIVNDWPIDSLGGRPATWEWTQRMDPKKIAAGKKGAKFSCLQDDGAAEVRVAVEEKLSGPSGTYSSVSVRIEISARCHSDEESIDAARDLLFNESLKAVAHYMNPAINMLQDHTSRG